MVIWSEYLTAIASAMGVNSTQAGMIISLVFTILSEMVIVIATRGKEAQVTIPCSTLVLLILFTFMGWIPIWTGSVLALVISIFIAYIFSR